MKNPNFVSDSMKSLQRALEMARDCYGGGRASILLRDFSEARRLLPYALRAINCCIEIHANLMEHADIETLSELGVAHQVAYIGMLMPIIKIGIQEDIDILQVCERLHNEGALPPIASVMN